MGKPVEGFEQKTDKVKFTCSFWLLYGEQSIKEQEWARGHSWEAGATIQVRGEDRSAAW